MIKKLSLILIIILISKNSWAAEQEILLKTDKDWSGQELIYPKNPTEMTSLRIVIAPQEIVPFHCHKVALFGYVLSGSINIETMSGKKQILKKGDVLVEVQNTWHLGFNPSKTKNTEIIMFYVGSKGVENAIIYNEANKGKCHE